MDMEDIQLKIIDHMIWIIATGFFIAFSLWLGGVYFSIKNLHFILYTGTLLGPLVLAESLALITGNFDLSVGQIAGFVAMVTGVLYLAGLPGYLTVPVAIAIGAVLGAVNGYFIGPQRLNPFLVTLSTFLIYKWGTLIVRKSSIMDIPKSLAWPGGGKIGPIYASIIILFGLIGLLWFILRKTKFGRHIYAVGGDPGSSQMLGVSVPKMTFLAFMIGGAISALSGIFYVGYSSAITSTLADGEVFMAFAGAVLGGIALEGGRGSVIGALGGVVLLGVLEAGLTMMMIPTEQQYFFEGGLVLAAVIINRFRNNIKERILTPGR